MVRFVFNNFGIKIICVFLAVLLWYALKNEETVSKKIEVIISPRYNSETMFLSMVEPASVEITLEGSRRAMKELNNPVYSVELDLTDKNKAQTVEYTLQRSDFSFISPGIKLVDTDQSKIEVVLDKLIEKDVEVEASLEGKTAPNYELKEIILEPNRIKIKGPEKILSSLNHIRTTKINIDNQNETFISEVYLVHPFEGYSGPKVVKVQVAIVKSKKIKVFEKIPVRIMAPVTSRMIAKITPPEVRIHVSASEIDFQGLSREDFSAFVDIRGLENRSYSLPVRVYRQNSAVQIIQVIPNSVDVTLEEAA